MSNTNEPCSRDFKIRLPISMYEELERLAAARGPGSKVAPLIREAIFQQYFSTDFGAGAEPEKIKTKEKKRAEA